MFSPEKREILVAALGEKKVQELESENKDLSDMIKSLGIEFKSRDVIKILSSDPKLMESFKAFAEEYKQMGWISQVMGLSTGG